jgi:hypothetical protein
MNRVLLWTPRILAALFALFISLFALDVFSAGYSLTEAVVALIVHLSPTYLVVAALIIAWRWEWLGGLAFTGLGLAYVLGFDGRLPWTAYAAIGGSLFLIAALFFIDGAYRRLRASM